ncbi:WD repeat-containing protein 41 isoform X5 [Phyllopteryx taeniolatus]|uniref:WD repeat-containing protein 41 isoform X5 n=1 Tax=Phyllopteryx taeniolatus TaxID=161469 RepID=UPI002AD55CC2|nr:WD repeat-containing protein 41 isoform X5 [Phyllopteryx taeniolatus]XP_061655098.1 WD repeat-containing protein 41 isoform X5 [Phyllopteryx taeniolatus]
MCISRGRWPGAGLERRDGRACAGAPRSLPADHRHGRLPLRRRPPRHRLLGSQRQPVGPRHWKQGADRSGPSVVCQGISSLIELPKNRVAAAVDKSIVIYKIMPCGDTLAIVEVSCLADHQDHIRALVNVNDGMFASGSHAGELILWDALDCSVLAYQHISREEPQTGTQSHVGGPKPSEMSIQHLASNGNLVAAAAGSGVYVFSAATGAAVAYRKRAHDSDVLHTALLSDRSAEPNGVTSDVLFCDLCCVCRGSELMSCSEDGSVRMWDIQELPLAGEPASPGFFGMWTLGRSSKQTCPASKKTPDLPAIRTLELTGDLIGHSGAVQMFLAFPENGLVTCSADHQLILWKNGEKQSQLRSLALFRKLEENGGL